MLLTSLKSIFLYLLPHHPHSPSQSLHPPCASLHSPSQSVQTPCADEEHMPHPNRKLRTSTDIFHPTIKMTISKARNLCKEPH